MSSQIKVCDIDVALKASLKAFRFRKEKTFAAIVMKIDKEKLLVIEDERFEDSNLEEVVSELPEHLPRYVVLSYRRDHGDGRVSFPLVFVFISPAGTKPELQMMYAGSKLAVVNELGLTKVFELRSTEEFTEEWLKEKLAFFR